MFENFFNKVKDTGKKMAVGAAVIAATEGVEAKPSESVKDAAVNKTESVASNDAASSVKTLDLTNPNASEEMEKEINLEIAKEATSNIGKAYTSERLPGYIIVSERVEEGSNNALSGDKVVQLKAYNIKNIENNYRILNVSFDATDKGEITNAKIKNSLRETTAPLSLGSIFEFSGFQSVEEFQKLLEKNGVSKDMLVKELQSAVNGDREYSPETRKKFSEYLKNISEQMMAQN